MLFAIIFLIAFVLLGVVAIVLSRTIDHGEARFDSETGKRLKDDEAPDAGPARPAQRLGETDDNTRNTDV